MHLSSPRTAVLEVPGATLHHELRGDGPLVVLIGAPMAADAFAPLADELARDHRVLTTDPRGIGRSRVEDPDADSTPELRAADLAALVESVGGSPAVVLGSSGGAVSTLALVQSRPELVRVAVAHEPPLDELLPDRAEQRERTRTMCETYLAGDVVGAWRMFMDQAGIPVPDEVLHLHFGPDRDAQVLADERFWFAHELRPSTWWLPDVEVLRSASTRLVLAVGSESAGQACDRTTRALGAALGREPVLFPGDHTGFVSDPAPFADRLRAVLDAHG